MEKIISRALGVLSILVIACACSDDLDINREYGFEVQHLPVQSKIKKGGTAEIRLQIVRSGRWEDARYYMRYFQDSGEGELKTADGMVFLMNDLYEMEEETFRLYYTSHCEDAQVVDLYFLSNGGTMCTLSFSFNNKSSNEENADDAS